MTSRPLRFLRAGFALAATLLALGTTEASATTIRVPAGIDSAGWDRLLAKYVDARGLVAYGAWKANTADVQRLDDFIAVHARSDGAEAQGDEAVATLINAYNAFTIRWILQHYPTESIRELDGSWNKARWNISGRTVSLDEIEHQNLRPLYGWKVHAMIVCAARSCPPLQARAYTKENLATLTAEAYQAWLAREDLNQFEPAVRIVRVSPIFKWFKSDFAERGSLDIVLERFGPERFRKFLVSRCYAVEYRDYDWGLNDQGDRGRNYRPGILGRLF
ncbi:MAG: DUF547 domain-containing protein [Opitutae bacterium]|nr:DUF547 domain-containing protein [Opitutae bacterium]